jgi:hypothetical protein
MPGEPTPLLALVDEDTPADYITIAGTPYPIRDLGRMGIRALRNYSKLYQTYTTSTANFMDAELSEEEADKAYETVLQVIQGVLPSLTMAALDSLDADSFVALMTFVQGRIANFTVGRQAPPTEPTAQMNTTNSDGQLSLMPSPLPTTTPDTVTTNG